MTHIIHWAKENKMAVNLLKTVEIVFFADRISQNGDLLPSVKPDVYSHCTNRFEHHTVAVFSLGGATAR